MSDGSIRWLGLLLAAFLWTTKEGEALDTLVSQVRGCGEVHVLRKG